MAGAGEVAVQVAVQEEPGLGGEAPEGAWVHVEGPDRPGVLALVFTVLAELGLNVGRASSTSAGGANGPFRAKLLVEGPAAQTVRQVQSLKAELEAKLALHMLDPVAPGVEQLDPDSPVASPAPAALPPGGEAASSPAPFGRAKSALGALETPSRDRAADAGPSPTPEDIVDAIMSRPVISIRSSDSLDEAMDLMRQHDISSLLVDTGRPGDPAILTKRDFITLASKKKDSKNVRVSEVMSQPVVTLPVKTSIHECTKVLKKMNIRRCVIRDPWRRSEDGLAQYVGLVSDTDIFKHLGAIHDVVAMTPVGKGLRHSKSVPGWRAGAEGAREGEEGGAGTPGAGRRSNVWDLSESSMAKAFTIRFSDIELGKKIGQGTFGAVHIGEWQGAHVAVKRMMAQGLLVTDSDSDVSSATAEELFTPKQEREEARLVKEFQREVEILAQLRHPSIVLFLGACPCPPDIALVMEFVPRGSLDQLLHASSIPLDLRRRCKMAMHVARGMAYLHSQGIIHRDLKAGNLLVGASFEIKVCDFGLSKMRNHASMTMSQNSVGTPVYAAPEVLKGEKFSEKCDVWSFGVVLHELMTRKRPYAWLETPIQVMAGVAMGTLRLGNLAENGEGDGGDVSAGIAALQERCCAWDAEERPGFGEILDVLEHEYNQLATLAREGGSTRSLASSSRSLVG